jgi:tRNA threonylcarbamoyladenosine biosynthesis protein TsaE
MMSMDLPTAATTRSASETRRMGRRIGRMLSGGGVVGLTGDLGAGKTVMADGIFHGAGLASSVAVTSPTFTLVNIYPGPVEMVHVDFYRLATAAEAVDAGLAEFWEDRVIGIVVIEWFEKFRELWPRDFLRVDLQIVGEKERKITIGRDRRAVPFL